MSFFDQLFQDPGKALEDVANQLLPVAGGAIGTFFGGPAGGALGAGLAGALVNGGKSGGGQSNGLASATGNPQERAAYAADPFAPQRPQYQQMLQQMMTNPQAFSQSAESKAVTQEGMDQMQLQMAQRGLGSSGAEKAALTKYATTAAGQDYSNQLARLMTLSGATSGAPGTSAGILSGAATERQVAQDTGMNSMIKLGSQAFGDWWNQPTPTDMTGFQTPQQPIQYQTSAPDTGLGSGLFNPQPAPTMTGGNLGSGTFDLGLSY